MNSTVESIHQKILIKFDSLIDSGIYLELIIKKFSEIKNINLIESNNFSEINNSIPLESSGLNFPENFKKKKIIKINFNLIIIQVYSEIQKIQKDLKESYIKYISVSAPILTELANIKINPELDPDIDKPEINPNEIIQIDKFEQVITSLNFIDKLDKIYFYLKIVLDKLNINPEFKEYLNSKNFYIKTGTRLGFDNYNFLEIDDLKDEFVGSRTGMISGKDFRNVFLQRMFEIYEENVISFPIKLKSITDCECGSKMIIDTSTSNKICETCGCEVYLPGTLFEEPQHHNNQNPLTNRNKRYDSNRHCERWIKQIQGTEDISGPAFNKVIERLDRRAVKEYTRDGRLRSMEGMKCAQIREWLKEYKLTTKWNDHVPLLRKTITGLHGKAVSPPQLTKEEEEDILMDFSLDMNLYEELAKKKEILQLIDKNKIKNKPFYPFGLLKVLCQKLKGDPRLQGLIESIHFQSQPTNVKNDQIHKIICQIRGKDYEPTDRTILLRNI